jgi:hypothetical protein
MLKEVTATSPMLGSIFSIVITSYNIIRRTEQEDLMKKTLTGLTRRQPRVRPRPDLKDTTGSRYNMKDSERKERTRKRELRTIRREWLVEHEKTRRERKQNEKRRAESDKAVSKKVLCNDNKRKTGNDKRPGPEKFLQAYSFIPVTAFDKRHTVPPGWKSRSFNEQRQYIDFFKTFIYPYPVPETVLFTAQNRETGPV